MLNRFGAEDEEGGASRRRCVVQGASGPTGASAADQGGPPTKANGGGSDILGLMADHRMSDVGGTSGGLGNFLAGFAMTCVGGYLLSNQVMVGSSYWNFYGSNTFGITLLPMLIGIGLLFFSGRNAVGWLLTGGGALFILAGVIANLHIYFQPTSLFNTLVMLILLAGGLGLIARALRPHGGGAAE